MNFPVSFLFLDEYNTKVLTCERKYVIFISGKKHRYKRKENTMHDTSDWTPQDWEIHKHDEEVQELIQEMRNQELLENAGLLYEILPCPRPDMIGVMLHRKGSEKAPEFVDEKLAFELMHSKSVRPGVLISPKNKRHIVAVVTDIGNEEGEDMDYCYGRIVSVNGKKGDYYQDYWKISNVFVVGLASEDQL